MTHIFERARVAGHDGEHTVVVDQGVVTAIVPVGVRTEVPRPDRTTDLAGRFLRPGLRDAHTHFTQWVVRRRRVDLAAATSAAAAVAIMREALHERAGDLVVGYGFRDALWADGPTRAALDAIAPERAVVLISGDLHCGWMNTAAFVRLGAAPTEDGVLREAEWIGTLDVLDRDDQPGIDDFQAAADAAASRGVVRIVDFENADNTRTWPERVAAGVRALRVEIAVWPDRLDDAIARGLRTGDLLDPDGLVEMGRLKIVADGSLNTRTAFCWHPYPNIGTGPDDAGPLSDFGVRSFDTATIEELVARAHGAGIEPAVHAIGDRSNAEVLDVFEALGVRGTIEHAQLVAADDFDRFGRLGLTASVQPEHAMDDRDVADRFWPESVDRAFAFGSLLRAGATLSLGSDAPVAPLDPWIAIAAAVSRSRDGRESWHPDERITVDQALAASSSGRTAVAVGDVADLVVLDDDPTTRSADHLRSMPVAATFVGGRPTWNTLEAR